MSRTSGWIKNMWSSKSASNSPLEIARLERRLRTEADACRAPLPQGLQRRTLNALQGIEPKRRALDSFRQPALVRSLVSLCTLVVVLVVASGRWSAPVAPSQSQFMAREVHVPSPRVVQQDLLTTFRAFESFTGLEMRESAQSVALMQEAKFLMQDASKAANAILVSMPRRLIPTTKEAPRNNGA